MRIGIALMSIRIRILIGINVGNSDPDLDRFDADPQLWKAPYDPDKRPPDGLWDILSVLWQSVIWRRMNSF
jgi:hypothetical protein